MRGMPNTMPREPPPPKEKRRIDQFPSREGSHAGGHDSPPPRTTRHARPARRDTRPAMHRTPGRRPGVPPRHSTDFTISSMTFFASPKTIIVLSM
ncbi:putative aBC transporter, substrate-binding protein, aliphatic sulfonate [Burkholderia pseudomallei]|nr:putative aBC transporter, substrate-binding protein, aliphatic sulfonate [Burkholderia pseudomallei]